MDIEGIMTKNSNLVPTNQEDVTRLLSGKDLKDWEIVERVLVRIRKDECTTTLAACLEAKVARSVYYAALNNPIVQQMRLQQIHGVAAATQRMVEKNWLPILANMATIAQSGDSRESVQAARFVKDVYNDIEHGLDPTSKGTGEVSDASKAIRSFLGGKRVKLTQTTVTQEIEVQDEVSDGKEDVIEGVATVITEE